MDLSAFGDKPYFYSQFSHRKRGHWIKGVRAFDAGHDSESHKLRKRYSAKMDLGWVPEHSPRIRLYLPHRFEHGGAATNSKREAVDLTISAPKRGLAFKEQNCLYPGDLYTFTRKPLFIIVDSDNR